MDDPSTFFGTYVTVAPKEPKTLTFNQWFWMWQEVLFAGGEPECERCEGEGVIRKFDNHGKLTQEESCYACEGRGIISYEVQYTRQKSTDLFRWRQKNAKT